MNSDTFKALVGKEVEIKLDDDVSIPLVVTGVVDGNTLECDDPNVCKNPFTVSLTGSLEQRVPESSFEVAGEGIDEGALFFVQPMVDLNPEDDKIPYTILVN